MFIKKSIKISDNQNDAEIVYFRKLTETYTKNGNIFPEDKLDLLIYNSVKKKYPNAEKKDSVISSKSEIETLKQSYSSKKKDIFLITITYNTQGVDINHLRNFNGEGLKLAISTYYYNNMSYSKMGNVTFCLSIKNGNCEVGELESLCNDTFWTIDELIEREQRISDGTEFDC